MSNVIRDLSNEDYHSNPALGSSGLKLLNKSPAHYYARYLDPNREPDEPTPAMKLGTATHMAVLEPEKFAATYVVVPEGIDKRSNAGKAFFAEIESSGKCPIKPDEMKQIQGMADSVHSHKVMRLLMSLDHQVEVSMFWIDQATGVTCKLRPDLMVPPCSQFRNGLVADLKTTTDASPEEFARTAWNSEMHLQAAWYTDGFMETYGTNEPPLFLWLAAEKGQPFARQFYSASRQLIEYGRREYRRLVDLYAQCQRTNQWPGYSEKVSELALPDWADRIIEQTISTNH